MRFLPVFALLLAGFQSLAQAITERDFKKHFDVHGVRGSFLLYDLKADTFIAYDPARCREGFLPASTFKIPNTLIGLETGLLSDTNYVFKWDGKPRWLNEWEADLTLSQAMRFSCLPCYQQLARQVGAVRYQQWLVKLNYGKMDVGVANVDSFWVAGRSRITQFQQVEFLKRLYLGQLPVSQRSMDLTKAIILLKKAPEYTLRGKTGMSNSDAVNRRYNGWFVGWLERGGNAYVFALNADYEGPGSSGFVPVRRAIAEAILREMGLM